MFRKGIEILTKGTNEREWSQKDQLLLSSLTHPKAFFIRIILLIGYVSHSLRIIMSILTPWGNTSRGFSYGVRGIIDFLYRVNKLSLQRGWKNDNIPGNWIRRQERRAVKTPMITSENGRRPYENLYIYYLEGRVDREEERLLGPEFLGNWVEEESSFLFFSMLGRNE